MSTIADEIIAKMNATHAKFLAHLAALDAATVNRRPADERWSPREIVAHLIDAERAHRRFLQAVVSGSEMPAIENFDLDVWNAARVAKRAGLTVAEVLAELEKERAETLAYLPTIPDDAWARTGAHASLGTVSVEQVARIIGLHERLHLQEMIEGTDAGA